MSSAVALFSNMIDDFRGAVNKHMVILAKFLTWLTSPALLPIQNYLTIAPKHQEVCSIVRSCDLSSLRDKWPIFLSLFLRFEASYTFICSLVHMRWSFYLDLLCRACFSPCILCATCSFCIGCAVSIHVLSVYIRAGSTHHSKIFHFRHRGGWGLWELKSILPEEHQIWVEYGFTLELASLWDRFPLLHHKRCVCNSTLLDWFTKSSNRSSRRWQR